MRKILLILVAITLVSCGARKVNKQHVETSETILVEAMVSDTTRVVTDETDNTITTINIEEDEITITPIDATKDIVVDGKPYRNVVITKKHKKDNSKIENKLTTQKDSSSSKTGRSISLDVKNAKIDIKSTEKEEPHQFYLYGFGFILLLLVLYYIYNKYIK